MNKGEGEGFAKLLLYFDLVKFDERKRKPIATKNTKAFYLYIRKLTKEKGRNQLRSFKSSMIDNLWHNYLVFALIYFIFLRRDYSNIILQALIIAGLIVIPLAYILFNRLAELIIHYSWQMRRDLEMALHEQFVINQLRRLGVSTGPVREPEGLSSYNYFTCRGRSYIFLFDYRESILQKTCLDIFDHIHQTSGMQLLLFTKRVILKETQEVIQHKGFLTVIPIENRKDLLEKLMQIVVDR